ncbi:tRNA-modifying protein YgfZ [Candidatus Erwinia haradaeae]|uniref:tRNA-modifying protein YgfZ n=1 Tax=Candidatus Erwinia haradaeae TaxID=1922217 RepID=A0A451DAE6_9GAMM|nr:tRNA-modifying protein YgfZ [Candidatus Erwinia haradaeae]VFP83245.1 tRNA-modifying protein YgfZ [Candidatus Erwinia haradaeae]
MPILPFPSQPLIESDRLPLTLVSLDTWALVDVGGDDRLRYLQGQITVDVIKLFPTHHNFAAHCNSSGKMWSNICLFHRGDHLTYIERRSVRNKQITELKKYAIFSKVTLSVDDHSILLGLVGAHARNALAQCFNILPNATSPVIQEESSTLLWFATPTERFILIVTPDNAAIIIKMFQNHAQLNDSKQWMLLDIEAGLPIIETETSGQFIPQATNLQALNAINFKKGCYIGQEIVARSTLRNTNQRALYALSGTSQIIPKINDKLEIKIRNQWRKTGTICAVCQIESSKIWVQAVLNKNLITHNHMLRVCGDAKSQLKIQKLPYTIYSA